MEILKGLESVKKKHCGAVVTIGNFDGVHMGHKKTLWHVLEEARMNGVPAIAVTFEPHPMELLLPEKGVRLLTPPEEKARLIEHYGIDALLFIKFDPSFAKLSADEFIEDVLVGKLAARMVIVGHNYAFGKGKKGTTELLRKRGKQLGFDVIVVRNQKLHGETVSSSRIRALLQWGRVKEAAELLERPYSIEGAVVKGAGRGAGLLGTPTANIDTRYEVIPKEGVYAVMARLGTRAFKGVANIGTNPTFQGGHGGQSRAENPLSIEVHMMRFKKDIIGEALRVFFVERIRDEKKFPDAESLREQIEKDILKAKDIISHSDYGMPI